MTKECQWVPVFKLQAWLDAGWKIAPMPPCHHNAYSVLVERDI